jgi:hypothetical protein
MYLRRGTVLVVNCSKQFVPLLSWIPSCR